MKKYRRIMIVDDHPFIRDGIKAVIKRDTQFEVVYETGSGNDAVDHALKLKPDIIIMDISLPDISGVEATKKITEVLPEIKVIILSFHQDIYNIKTSFKAGARGYMVKGSDSSTILEAMSVVLKDKPFLDIPVSSTILKEIMADDFVNVKLSDLKYKSLTRRQQEVLYYIAKGLTSNQIARKLQIKPSTVGNHRAQIMRKLDIHTAAELGTYATKIGLMD